jgi:S-methylmethionine-dependent homocysteine/selenocysteine methylase
MSNKLERPREIIDYCLKPLAAHSHSEEYKETYRRLEHAIKTLQAAALKAHAPVAVDFSEMRTITLNEEAHGHE